jgi:hypothetical protein
MIVAKWKHGFEGLHHADAQKVYNEISAIGEQSTPEQIVEKAKDERTELHRCFDWNDTTAAHKYRLQQARQIVCHLAIQNKPEQSDRPEVRALFKPHLWWRLQGYRHVAAVQEEQAEVCGAPCLQLPVDL